MLYGMTDDRLRTTVYLSAPEYRRLKALAAAQGRSAAALIREAVAEYARHHAPRTRPRSIGAIRAGADFSARAEELLEGFGEES